jgi:hypothetical protein
MQTQERPASLRGTQGVYNPPPARRLFNGWLEHRRVDYPIVIVLCGIASAVLYHFNHFPFTEIVDSDRHTVYQVAIQVSATLGGFVLTSVSVLVNLLRTPLAAIDKVLPPEDKRVIGNAFIGCLPATAFVFFTALAGFIWDHSKDGSAVIEGLFLFSCLLALLRYARIVGILKLLLPVAS